MGSWVIKIPCFNRSRDSSEKTQYVEKRKGGKGVSVILETVFFLSPFFGTDLRSRRERKKRVQSTMNLLPERWLIWKTQVDKFDCRREKRGRYSFENPRICPMKRGPYLHRTLLRGLVHPSLHILLRRGSGYHRPGPWWQGDVRWVCWRGSFVVIPTHWKRGTVSK